MATITEGSRITHFPQLDDLICVEQVGRLARNMKDPGIFLM